MGLSCFAVMRFDEAAGYAVRGALGGQLYGEQLKRSFVSQEDRLDPVVTVMMPIGLSHACILYSKATFLLLGRLLQLKSSSLLGKPFVATEGDG